jgi:hypothetical protein
MTDGCAGCSLEQVMKETRDEFPKFKVVPKSESFMMKAINAFLLVVSFGQMKAFMTGFATTVGTTVYVTPGWPTKPDADKAILLRHERVHMRQARRLTRPLFSFLYLLAFLPGGLAWFRARFEMEAYAETVKATFEHYGRQAVFSKDFRDRIAKNFTGPQYLWMWPFPKTVDKWILDAVEKVAGKETPS